MSAELKFDEDHVDVGTAATIVDEAEKVEKKVRAEEVIATEFVAEKLASLCEEQKDDISSNLVRHSISLSTVSESCCIG